MEKKYQVFVSSTYKDLTEERQEVIQALLELDCIPVGMELFPAADDDQWTLIKRLIDDCDYYILIVGGRYGSINAEGISYTQMEYEYALEKQIPIISFLHKNPEAISVGKTEKDPTLQTKLDDFKKLAEQKMCRYWETPTELGSIVSRSLVKLIKEKPRSGWVKATFIPNEETTQEILSLKKQIERLNLEIERSQTKAPKGTETLSQEDDTVEIEYTYEGYNYRLSPRIINYKGTAICSWNEIFSDISPLMIDEVSEISLRNKIDTYIFTKQYSVIKKNLEKADREIDKFKIIDNSFHTLKIQFRALGLITESIKKRGVHDTNKYWSLTTYGDTKMTMLRAIKK